MFAVYFVWVLSILSSSFERNVSAATSPGCLSVAATVLKNPFWSFSADQKILQLILSASKPSKVPPCSCGPAVGGLGDVARIDQVDSITGLLSSNHVCSGCSGDLIVDADVKFSLVGILSVTVGPCPGITVYRCRCLKPTTTTRSAATTTITTEPPATTTVTSEPPPTTTTTTEPPPTTTITTEPPATTTIIAGTTTGGDYTCSFDFGNGGNTYDCGASNPCVAGNYDYSYADATNALRFPGKRGPSSYVQCSDIDDSCTEMYCSNNQVFRQSDCTCVPR